MKGNNKSQRTIWNASNIASETVTKRLGVMRDFVYFYIPIYININVFLNLPGIEICACMDQVLQISTMFWGIQYVRR